MSTAVKGLEARVLRTHVPRRRVARDPQPAIPVSRRIAYGCLLCLGVLFCSELVARTAAYCLGLGFLDNPSDFTSPFFTTAHPLYPRVEDGVYTFANGRSVTPEKPADELRIVFLGGSTTVNARAGIRYSDLLETELRNEGSPVVALNAATDGYSTAHSLVNFGLRCLEVKPDVIMVYHNINDLSANHFGDQVEPDYSNKYLTPYYLGYQHRTGLLAQFEKVSRLARLARITWGTVQCSTTDVSKNWEEGLKIFKRNLRTIRGIASAHGIEVVLATQAARSDLRAEAGFREYNEAIRQLAIQEGIPFADLANELTDDTCFVDRVHFSRAGVQRVAAELLPTFRDVLGRCDRRNLAMRENHGQMAGD